MVTEMSLQYPSAEFSPETVTPAVFRVINLNRKMCTVCNHVEHQAQLHCDIKTRMHFCITAPQSLIHT